MAQLVQQLSTAAPVNGTTYTIYTVPVGQTLFLEGFSFLLEGLSGAFYFYGLYNGSTAVPMSGKSTYSQTQGSGNAYVSDDVPFPRPIVLAAGVPLQHFAIFGGTLAVLATTIRGRLV